MEFVSKVGESVFSMLGEKLVNYTLGVKDKATFTSLKDNVRKLSAIAFDVDEKIKKAELLGNKKRKREVEEWLETIQTLENEFCQLESEIQVQGFIKRFFGEGRAAELDARISKLVEQSQQFSELVVDCRTKGETLITCELVGKEFERNLERIVNFLVENDGLCIGIYGMGGAGKTTLAKHINNKILKHHGYAVSWITVSQEFHVTSLQNKIAQDVGIDLSNENSEEKRASWLHKVLSQEKKRLLIFDDMWEAIDLKKMGIPLAFGGCKLLITTRTREVCLQMKCKQDIKLKPLDEEEAWNLFSQELGQEVNLTPEVQKIARSMVELCDGSPLGIITLAGSMRGEMSEYVWSDALEELKESMMDRDDFIEKVFKVLRYSFDRLGKKDGSHDDYTKLQNCFLHCSLYPEDHEIHREKLIRMFILEKFLDKRTSREALIVQGHAILDKLVNACLLEVCKGGMGVKMHDLVRAMALKIMEGKTKVISNQFSMKEIPNEEEWTKDLEKMSLMRSGIRQIMPNMSPCCSNLKTLLMGKNVGLEVIPNDFFLKMHSLCILDLSRTSIKELPNSLSDMEKLEALLLAYCEQLVSIPNMKKLKLLRELDVSGTAICEVPQGMENAIKLKSLLLHQTQNLQMLPQGFLLNFPDLQCLYLPNHIQAPIGEIEKLNHLEEFCGRLKGDFNLEGRRKQRICSYSIVVSLDDSLYDFTICGGSRQNFLPPYESDTHGKGVIMLQKCIEPPKFSSCAGRSRCVAENFGSLNTKCLSVSRCNEMECIWRRERLVATNIVTSTSLPLSPPLSNSILSSSLMKLVIVQCKKMKKLGLTASQLPNIEEIRITDCGAIEELLEEERGSGGEVAMPSIVCLPKLTNLSVQRCEKIKKLKLSASQLPNIEEIWIQSCFAIEELFEHESRSGGETATSSIVPLPKLTYLDIFNCKKMKKVGLSASQLPNIEEIVIWRCDAIEELLEEESGSGGEVATPNIASLPKLTNLYIKGCEKMKKLRLSPSQFPNIEEIWIEDCIAIEELFEEESRSGRELATTFVVPLAKLQALKLRTLPRLKSISNTTTIACPSIEEIVLIGCPILKKLPLIFGESNYSDSAAPSTLRRIQLKSEEKEWWERMELGHPTHHLLLQPFLHLD